jgi:DoxX-like protein
MQTIAHDNPFARTITSIHACSRRALWTGRVLSGLAVAFLIFDSVGKLLEVQPVIDGTKQLGYPPEIVFSLGVVLLSCVLAYLLPRTSVLGALLLTGYLGGAVATHVRVGNPLFTHVLFPTYVAALLWGGLLLRDERLRAFLPWRDRSRS